jgi:hypothetical protein
MSLWDGSSVGFNEEGRSGDGGGRLGVHSYIITLYKKLYLSEFSLNDLYKKGGEIINPIFDLFKTFIWKNEERAETREVVRCFRNFP